MLISQLHMLKGWEQKLLFKLFLNLRMNFGLDLQKFFIEVLSQKVDWDIAIFEHMRVSSEHLHVKAMEVKALLGNLLLSLFLDLLLFFANRLWDHVKSLLA